MNRFEEARIDAGITLNGNPALSYVHCEGKKETVSSSHQGRFAIQRPFLPAKGRSKKELVFLWIYIVNYPQLPALPAGSFSLFPYLGKRAFPQIENQHPSLLVLILLPVRECP